jgi:hypothetical protein
MIWPNLTDYSRYLIKFPRFPLHGYKNITLGIFFYVK